MRGQTLILAATFATTFASPLTQLWKREKVYNEHGNLKLTSSKDTVALGDIKINDTKQKPNKACHDSGQCETNDIKMKGQLLSTDQANNIELTLGPDGSYPSDMRRKLLDALFAAVNGMAKCEKTKHKGSSSCPNPMVFCPAKDKTVTQCKVPKYWGVNYQDPKEKKAAPPNIGTSLEVKVVGDKVCQDTMGALSGVAGAVSGVAGGTFTLLSFACN
ncbi:hypothetical protein PMIN01_10775 [Paraphaeosphaeria minitans]|uniref:Uncharacterized protein n=1 Tax=Paraphaeosphaeria minitans TaxID=565426 RepID=A0A9P6GAW8_9PLEO|nr:hypothetical protein PMIN01_10775 [Paraphaeosphaeria minitans]